jgi:isoleucyl-tRNA synthetase
MKQKNEGQNKAYPEFEGLNLSSVDQQVLEYWKTHKVFEKSVSERKDNETFVFYEGPPSANGMPGIHHVMARTVKDIFCRYKTMQGYKVERKGGWDTHGLPVELKVEQELGITKEDIGNKISVDEYNQKCKETVMQFKDVWDDLTIKMGYWVDLDNPYITFENDYIESVWWVLSQLFEKGLMYKGYTIQPYSPAAGTGLSSHELNQPGCYKDVTDTSAVAQFRVIKNEKSAFLFDSDDEDVCFIAWTTTPWTLPSNTALAVGKDIQYVKVKTNNPYTQQPVSVILAEDLLEKWFPGWGKTETGEERYLDTGIEFWGDVVFQSTNGLSFSICKKYLGADLDGIRYEQLLPYFQPENGDAFRVILGDFVTTSDGTGIVHIAPSFGADDKRVAEENGIGSLTLVDTQGKFVEGVCEFSGRYVKDYTDAPDYKSVDIDISIKLKQENKAFNVQKYKHNYPHCWRTDKPIIYYPLDSWFIKTTAVKEKLIANNHLINWKPKSTGEGRFGKWLEDLKDWNLSRSRYWGIPMPIWRTEDKLEQICIGSVAQLNAEMEKANKALGLNNQPLKDLHRPYIDEVILVSPSGKPMSRELDVIDVWFDSGSMPYAQWGYPQKKDSLEGLFPADFIAEGVDQTRGWFFTLHAIATMLFDKPAFKNVIANGLVLDKNGQKMSKRLGNAIDPFSTLKEYGADATRWYMIANAPPWDNLKFDLAGVDEVRRKFFGTLYNTYSFFALYANIDKFTYSEKEVPLENRQEIDRWILSVLNTLIIEVKNALDDYDPTKAARLIQTFLDDNLSNWYVRLNRRRFWKGDYSEDKITAYQTLYKCLETISLLSAPIAPFFSEFLYQNLNKLTGRIKAESVHLALFPEADTSAIDSDLEERMALSQTISSLVLSLRKNEKIKVRQPLSKILIPVLSNDEKEKIEKVESYILNEINVKAIEYITDTSGIIKKKIKPNFKTLGPKYGKKMKEIGALVAGFTQEDIRRIEQQKQFQTEMDGEPVLMTLEDFEISSDDIPGWLVASENGTTVALDITISDELKSEGDAREFINKVQNLRKDKNFEVTDKILVRIKEDNVFKSALIRFKSYICAEILANDIVEVDSLDNFEEVEVNDTKLFVQIVKN